MDFDALKTAIGDHLTDASGADLVAYHLRAPDDASGVYVIYTLTLRGNPDDSYVNVVTIDFDVYSYLGPSAAWDVVKTLDEALRFFVSDADGITTGFALEYLNPMLDETDLRLVRVNGAYSAEWASASLAQAQ